MTSDKKNIALLADIFIKKGLSDIVISPGSRNAPIILTLTNLKEIRALSVVDERSAAFFALGMAQQKGEAVAVSCTSGSAVLNYAPAIAEAYYQKIPLLVFTADRPPELIDKGDGQTIRQKNVFANFVKAGFELPVKIDDSNYEATVKTINEAIDLTQFPDAGPVHINIPFREPLYNTTEESIEGRAFDTQKPLLPPEEEKLIALAELWKESCKVMLLAGQMNVNPALNELLRGLSDRADTVVLTETTSNLHGEKFVDCIDNVVSTFGEPEAFRPGLLITFGGQVVSKMVKKLLRAHKPDAHWHISPSGEEMDTYFSLTETVSASPEAFFEALLPRLAKAKEGFAGLWQRKLQKIRASRKALLQQLPYSDLQVFDFLLKAIPPTTLHLANSTPVRYSQLFGHLQKFVYRSNRGVSGIDGQVSTAAGAAFASDKTHTLITGDLGFFYDSNALMNHHLTPNLKIIVINNGGGGIFRFIEGPASTPQLEQFFEASHNWKAEHIARAFGIAYFHADSPEQLQQALPDFYGNDFEKPALLEIFTPVEVNARVLRNYFLHLKGLAKD